MMKKQLKAKVKDKEEIYSVIEFAYDCFVKVRSYYGNVVVYEWDEVELMIVYED